MSFHIYTLQNYVKHLKSIPITVNMNTINIYIMYMSQNVLFFIVLVHYLITITVIKEHYVAGWKVFQDTVRRRWLCCTFSMDDFY